MGNFFGFLLLVIFCNFFLAPAIEKSCYFDAIKQNYCSGKYKQNVLEYNKCLETTSYDFKEKINSAILNQ